MKTDTIAAIATAMSNSGIGIVRISGDEALLVADRIFKPKAGNKKVSEMESHTVHYGYVMDGDETIDEVLLILMRAPKTYTREDVVEIDCHGGILVMKRLLETVLKYGARPAEPGEFTKRAFLNGRIDLSQAESVIDVINAKNDLALKSSVSQLRGAVLDKIKEIRSVILHELAFIESAIDDPEHYSLDGYQDELTQKMNDCLKKVTKLLDSADNGKMMKEGINTVIVGKPNAGKSSLLNLLVGEERAIVTEVAGTTRDILEEQIQIGGVGLNVIDTAGIRDTDDIVEKIGVSRSREYLEKADLVIYVVDSSTKLDENDREIIESIRDKKAIVLLNKSDLPAQTEISEIEKLISQSEGMSDNHNSVIEKDKKSLSNKEESFDDGNCQKEKKFYDNERSLQTNKCKNEHQILTISAKEREGIDKLEQTIQNLFFDGKISFNDEVYITNARQKNALAEAKASLELVMQSILNGMPEDFYTIDMMSAYEELGSVIGEQVGDDLVNEIFSKFCMGK